MSATGPGAEKPRSWRPGPRWHGAGGRATAPSTAPGPGLHAQLRGRPSQRPPRAPDPRTGARPPLNGPRPRRAPAVPRSRVKTSRPSASAATGAHPGVACVRHVPSATTHRRRTGVPLEVRSGPTVTTVPSALHDTSAVRGHSGARRPRAPTMRAAEPSVGSRKRRAPTTRAIWRRSGETTRDSPSPAGSRRPRTGSSPGAGGCRPAARALGAARRRHPRPTCRRSTSARAGAVDVAAASAARRNATARRDGRTGEGREPTGMAGLLGRADGTRRP